MATTMSRPTGARELLQHQYEDLVAAEIARLSRRVSALHQEHLGQVEAALTQAIDHLVLSRALAISVGELAALFDLADDR